MVEMHNLIRHELFELLKFNDKYKSFGDKQMQLSLNCFYEAILSF